MAFDRLPYRNKVVFTHKPYPEIKSAFYIRGFEDRDTVGVLSDFRPGYFRRRWIDQFDYVRFLNGKGIRKPLSLPKALEPVLYAIRRRILAGRRKAEQK